MPVPDWVREKRERQAKAREKDSKGIITTAPKSDAPVDRPVTTIVHKSSTPNVGRSRKK